MAKRAGGDAASAAVACACGAGDQVGPGGRAVEVDPAAREANLKRLRRIEGQVRGLQKMVEEGRYCADVLTQIASVHEALRAVGRELMRNHLKHCATTAIRAGGEEAEGMYDELLDLMYRQVR
ncbi:MAG TPA: metal-sensitive transcriptional regulator [Anaeromyxobacteraceae bacterium]|nr:metal-sensitive transcriptional regulator [Anaeromyxobacteraceae bacterium]